MLLNVESVQLSKSGKSYWVKAGGNGYSSKAKGIEQTAGKSIEAVLGSFTIGNERVDTIDGFTVVSGPVEAPRAVSGDRWWINFVSNQTHALIQCGEIKDEPSLNRWMRALKQAVVALDALEPDDISF
jgi:hypothetical protein